ncbi:MAG TPA: hypothetical protein VNL14_17405 [Candidatus Acidoferrales bacterium]|nr:hypothetical protein [Candidatus Acidoferrales bacterium]
MREQKKSLFSVVLLSILILGASVAQAIVVTSTANSGAGSLRQAINDANSDGVPTTITFDPVVFPAGGNTTIFLTSQLPALTGVGDTIDGGAVILDGPCPALPPPDGAGSATVILDGSFAAPDDSGLRVRASNVTLRSLWIQNFSGDGIRVQPAGGASGVSITGVVISENVIRSNQDGVRVSAQEGPGNHIEATISNNAVDLNRDDGIFVRGSNGNPSSTVSSSNTVEVVIESNCVSRSQGVATGGETTGDGIRVHAGNNGGSGNAVTAMISNNTLVRNVEDGIAVAGTGLNGTASDNTIDATVINNRVIGPGPQTNSLTANGILIRGGNRAGAVVAGENNHISFLIQDNKVRQFRDNGIHVSGGRGQFHNVSGSVVANIVDGNNGPISTGILIRAGAGNNSNNNTLENISVEGNSVRKSLGDGIRVALGNGSGHVVSLSGVTGNESNENGADGLSIGGGVQPAQPGITPISGNTTDKNGEDGMDIDATDFVLSNNSAKKNVGAGIDAVGNIDGGGNTATGNASCNTPGCF